MLLNVLEKTFTSRDSLHFDNCMWRHDKQIRKAIPSSKPKIFCRQSINSQHSLYPEVSKFRWKYHKTGLSFKPYDYCPKSYTAYLTSLFNIIIFFYPGFQTDLFLLGSPNKIFNHVLHSCHIHFPSRCTWFGHANIWRGLKHKRLIISYVIKRFQNPAA